MGIVIVGILLAVLAIYFLFTTMQEMKIKKGEKAVEEGNLDMALSIFMDSLARDPENVDALWHLGNINEEKGNILEAIGYYNHIIQLKGESKLFTMFELFRRNGMLYRKTKRDKESLESLLMAYQMMPNNKEILKNIADIVFQQKQFYRAMPFFEKASVASGDDGKFLSKYGFCLLMVDSLNDALNVLESANNLIPDDFTTKFLLAYAYLKTGNYRKGKEYIEDVVNSESQVLTIDQMYYALKILILCYLLEKNYEVARELHKKMESMLGSVENRLWHDEASMAYIFLRAEQGYFDLALERFNEILDVGIDLDGVSEGDTKKIKENRSHIYDVLSTLTEFKTEKDKRLESGENPRKLDVSMSMLEADAKDARKELVRIFDDWKKNYVSNNTLWKLFKPRVNVSFDPTPILDKFSEENIKVMKDKFSSMKINTAVSSSLLNLGIDPKKPVQSVYEMDFTGFNIMGKELVQGMGFVIVDPTIKVDSVASSEGLGIDFLCEEKYGRRQRVLVLIRRWKEPIGMITLMNMIDSISSYSAKRLIIVSCSPLNNDAQKVVDKHQDVEFHSGDEIPSYFK